MFGLSVIQFLVTLLGGAVFGVGLSNIRKHMLAGILLTIAGVLIILFALFYPSIQISFNSPPWLGCKENDPCAKSTETVDVENISTPAPTISATEVQPTESAQAQPTQIIAPTSTPTEEKLQPTATTAPTSTLPMPTAVVEPTTGELFHTPVQCTKKFNDESSWLICEPGEINDNTTAWTIGQLEASYHQNVPEGAFAYFSLGQGNIAIDGVNFKLKGETGLNFLVIIRGRIDDNIVDSDLNETAVITKFVPGHAIWAYMPKGAYVSMNWFRQQLVASTTEGFTNCGATGCSRVKVILFDVNSHFYQEYEIRANDLDNWTLLESR
jgi:hypothetical protein